MQPTKVSSSIPEQPSARGMYLFEAENEGELGFKEGEVLTLISKIDDNWYEGMNDGGDVSITYTHTRARTCVCSRTDKLLVEQQMRK